MSIIAELLRVLSRLTVHLILYLAAIIAITVIMQRDLAPQFISFLASGLALLGGAG